MYFIVDLIADYKAFASFDDVKNLLIDRTIEDLKENLDDKDIIKNDVDIIEKLARNKNISLNYLIEHLDSFSYKIVDLIQLQRDLEDLASFTGEEHLINAVIKLINEK